jgi:hypothetical protein
MPTWHADCQCFSGCRCCCVCTANPDMTEELSQEYTDGPEASAGTETPGGGDPDASDDLTASTSSRNPFQDDTQPRS